MMHRFQQVRLIADSSRFGQLAWIEDRTEDATTGPLWECSVQWAGEGGNTRGHYLSEIRPETFLEFLFMRKTVGKANGMFAAFCVLAWGAMLFPAPVIAMSFMAFFFLVQYIYFKGILR